MTRPTLPETATARHARELEEDQARYGELLPDVEYLRRRGDVITKDVGQLLVNGRPMSGQELAEKAARERRLGGVAAAPIRRVVTTASGLRVGDRAALTPKVVRPVVVRRSAPRPAKVPAVANATALRGAAAVAKARSEQHSTNLGAKPRVVWLDLALLDVDRTYQREIGEGGQTHINRIVRAFNWNCYQPIIVTERGDGRYAVIDGQHRLEAAWKHPLIDSLPCYIIDAPDVAAQARVFVEVNSARRSLTSAQKFFASLAAGEKHAAALKKICDAAGVTILRGPPGKITPPKALLGPLVAQRLVQRFGVMPVRQAMQLLAETHGQTAGAFRSGTISALTRIIAGPHSRERLRSVLQAADLDQLLGQASALAKGGGVASLTSGMERVLRAAIETKAAA